MISSEWHVFEDQFRAKFGAARFNEDKSKVDTEKAVQIFEKLDDFNPDDEEDVEEIDSTDGQLNEMLHNMTLNDEIFDIFISKIKELEKIIKDGLYEECLKELSTGARLGNGSFGTVYEAIPKSGERMALKIMLLNDEKSNKSVILEIKIMHAINKVSCSNFYKLDKNDPLDGKKEEEEKIPKLVLLLTKGEELENYMIKSKHELITIVMQVDATIWQWEKKC